MPLSSTEPSPHGGGCVTAFGASALAAGTTIAGRSPVDDNGPASGGAPASITSVERPLLGGGVLNCGGGGFTDGGFGFAGPGAPARIVCDTSGRGGGGATPRVVARGSFESAGVPTCVTIAPARGGGGDEDDDVTGDAGTLPDGDFGEFTVGISSCVKPVH